MLTSKQIERLWQQHDFRKLVVMLTAGRAEFPADVVAEFAEHPVAAASLAIIRLNELHQARSPVVQRLIEFIIGQRDPDLLWGNLTLSCVAIRALLANSTTITQAQRSLAVMAPMQKEDGSFPAQPIRRLSGDPATTALVVALLGNDESFVAAVDINNALVWLSRYAPSTLRGLVRVAEFRTARAA
jgi:hypothetical protein